MATSATTRASLKLRPSMPAEKPPKVPANVTKAEVQALVDALFPLTRASKMRGPMGTWAYFISDDNMTAARAAITHMKVRAHA